MCIINFMKCYIFYSQSSRRHPEPIPKDGKIKEVYRICENGSVYMLMIQHYEVNDTKMVCPFGKKRLSLHSQL